MGWWPSANMAPRRNAHSCANLAARCRISAELFGGNPQHVHAPGSLAVRAQLHRPPHHATPRLNPARSPSPIRRSRPLRHWQ